MFVVTVSLGWIIKTVITVLFFAFIIWVLSRKDKS